MFGLCLPVGDEGDVDAWRLCRGGRSGQKGESDRQQQAHPALIARAFSTRSLAALTGLPPPRVRSTLAGEVAVAALAMRRPEGALTNGRWLYQRLRCEGRGGQCEGGGGGRLSSSSPKIQPRKRPIAPGRFLSSLSR